MWIYKNRHKVKELLSFENQLLQVNPVPQPFPLFLLPISPIFHFPFPRFFIYACKPYPFMIKATTPPLLKLPFFPLCNTYVCPYSPPPHSVIRKECVSHAPCVCVCVCDAQGRVLSVKPLRLDATLAYHYIHIRYQCMSDSDVHTKKYNV